MNSINFRSGIVYFLIIAALGAFLYTSIIRRSNAQPEIIPIAEVAQMVRAGDAEKLLIKEDRITVVKSFSASPARTIWATSAMGMISGCALERRMIEV